MYWKRLFASLAAGMLFLLTGFFTYTTVMIVAEAVTRGMLLLFPTLVVILAFVVLTLVCLYLGFRIVNLIRNS